MQEATIKRVRFSEIKSRVPPKPGIYEIHTDIGIPLKVGIAKNLRDRLLKHRASRQSCLKLKPGGLRCNPADVRSKGSILAKHLYYDSSLAREFDFKSEAGRRAFLEQKCYIIYEVTQSKAYARKLEKLRENSDSFRYMGKVSKL